MAAGARREFVGRRTTALVACGRREFVGRRTTALVACGLAALALAACIVPPTASMAMPMGPLLEADADADAFNVGTDDVNVGTDDVNVAADAFNVGTDDVNVAADAFNVGTDDFDADADTMNADAPIFDYDSSDAALAGDALELTVDPHAWKRWLGDELLPSSSNDMNNAWAYTADNARGAASSQPAADKNAPYSNSVHRAPPVAHAPPVGGLASSADFVESSWNKNNFGGFDGNILHQGSAEVVGSSPMDWEMLMRAVVVPDVTEKATAAQPMTMSMTQPMTQPITMSMTQPAVYAQQTSLQSLPSQPSFRAGTPRYVADSLLEEQAEDVADEYSNVSGDDATARRFSVERLGSGDTVTTPRLWRLGRRNERGSNEISTADQAHPTALRQQRQLQAQQLKQQQQQDFVLSRSPEPMSPSTSASSLLSLATPKSKSKSEKTRKSAKAILSPNPSDIHAKTKHRSQKKRTARAFRARPHYIPGVMNFADIKRQWYIGDPEIGMPPLVSWPSDEQIGYSTYYFRKVVMKEYERLGDTRFRARYKNFLGNGFATKLSAACRASVQSVKQRS